MHLANRMLAAQRGSVVPPYGCLFKLYMGVIGPSLLGLCGLCGLDSVCLFLHKRIDPRFGFRGWTSIQWCDCDVARLWMDF